MNMMMKQNWEEKMVSRCPHTSHEKVQEEVHQGQEGQRKKVTDQTTKLMPSMAAVKVNTIDVITIPQKKGHRLANIVEK